MTVLNISLSLLPSKPPLSREFQSVLSTKYIEFYQLTHLTVKEVQKQDHDHGNCVDSNTTTSRNYQVERVLEYPGECRAESPAQRQCSGGLEVCDVMHLIIQRLLYGIMSGG